jgi:hypothetical protein
MNREGKMKATGVSLPIAVREQRRKEIESDLAEHIRDERTGGYPPVEIALHILARWLCGILDDICWFAAEARGTRYPRLYTRPLGLVPYVSSGAS